ncbi:cyclic lactone autoinducer peptide [Hathewaya histolytica]|uniref:Cyclic lactone autoinducer peptide n=1 Tax=Hathewaya histolytica TaxID=1498 RepID=A0A4U9RK85_HATHI|nr:cyclic lactone autoinducer peptide [Hathewaya histolytica]VTQ92319.1 cyclic lactone autoinducer peptide [Hathewaya histolytica]
MLRKFLEFTKSLFGLVAVSNASAACAYLSYQPEMPEELDN